MAADRALMSKSPAYQVLTEAGRRVLDAVEGEVERNGPTVIRIERLAKLTGMSKGAAFVGGKQITMLGFFSVTQGPRPHRLNTFRFSDAWQSINMDEAERLALRARLPKEPAPAPVVPPPRERRTPSLPVLHFADDP
jgi:hypothetical protein